MTVFEEICMFLVLLCIIAELGILVYALAGLAKFMREKDGKP